MSIQVNGATPVKRSVLPLPTPRRKASNSPVKSAQDKPSGDRVTLSKPSSTQGAFNAKQLFAAVVNGYFPRVLAILNSNISVESKDGFGNRPMHKAAFYGHAEVIRELKRRGAEVNPQDNRHRQTPMHKAAYGGHYKAAEALLELGGNVKAVDEFGNTPLHAAVSDGHNRVAALLLQHDADVNAPDNDGNTPMHKAAHHGQVNSMLLLARNGGNLDQPNQKGQTPLDLLLKRKPHVNVAGLRKAAEKFPQISSPTRSLNSNQSQDSDIPSPVSDDEPTTPVKRALSLDSKVWETDAEESDIQCVEPLTPQEKEVLPTDDVPQSVVRPLHHTVEFQDYDDLQALIRKSNEKTEPIAMTERSSQTSEESEQSPRSPFSPVSFTSIQGDTPELTSDEETSPLVKPAFNFSMPEWMHDFPAFLTAKRRAQDSSGKTRLHHAAARGDTMAVQHLLDVRGLKPAFNIFVGNNPLGRAFVPLGQEPNAINLGDQDNNTALHEAVKNGHWNVAELLMEEGANPFMTNRDGMTPAFEMPWPTQQSSPEWLTYRK